MNYSQELGVIGLFPTPKGSLKSFLDAVTIWINKPHCVNKRLCGSKIWQIRTADSKDKVSQIICGFQQNGEDSDNNSHTENNDVNLKENTEKFIIVLRENLPKQIKIFSSLLEAVVYDSAAQSVTFYPIRYISKSAENKSDINNQQDVVVQLEAVYCFTFLQETASDSSVQLRCSKPLNESLPPSSHVQVTPHWLKDTLGLKIRSWTELSNLTTSVTSLRLVGVECYNQLYNELKGKYGEHLVKNWKETTDPQKFVFEDIGIATYLLLIWEADRQRLGTRQKQSFVDLGCGNGLLVYILSSEGHPGLGIDLRKRNIWDTFGQHVKLEEKSITPSAENLFPDYDWIIGNHSDELTPWIPVIAARSSYTCSYFVLPCCHHDFNRRFSGKMKGESNYRSYLTYIAQVGKQCGFDVEEDVLRIPSTKRVCHIGRTRTYPREQEPEADRKRQAFIDQRCKTSASENASLTNRTPDAGLAESASVSISQKVAVKRPSDNSGVVDQDSLEEGDLPCKKGCSEVNDVIRSLENSDVVRENDNRDSNTVKHMDPNAVNTERNDSVAEKNANLTERRDNLTDKNDGLKAENGGTGQAQGVWAEHFQARSSTEAVRNCQKVGKETKERVVRAVFEAVISAGDATVVKGQDGREWRRGGSIELGEVAQMLDTATREELKSECGGVQTLLRNHNYIFQVSGGKVQLRDFSVDNPWSQRKGGKKSRNKVTDSAAYHKTSLCWFHGNHPDGCPRKAEHCSFAHGEHELRPRADFPGKKDKRR